MTTKSWLSGRRLFIALSISCLALSVVAATPLFADASVDDGRRIYRSGILPSGEALSALVAGDVPIQGDQLNCRNCHGRSGLGSTEGSYIVPAISGSILFSPYPQPRRPGYDLASLGRALRDGVSASGRPLSPLMPRYRLSDREIADIYAYLGELTTDPSAGVDNENIYFATVITDDVGDDERDAVLAVLRKFVDEKNRQTRLESKRWDRQFKPESVLPTLYRNWVHEVWSLTGPSSGWAEQLEAYYRARPVFALLGGLSNQPWDPIAGFCERRQMPCLFPSTGYPQSGSEQRYTHYYSPGTGLEAELIVAHLAEHPVARVVQVYCGTAAGALVARLGTTLEERGVAVEQVGFECGSVFSRDRLARFLQDNVDTAVIAWLSAADLRAVSELDFGQRFYLSSTLLNLQPGQAFQFDASEVFLAHPFRLAEQPDPAMTRFRLWARTRQIEVRYPRWQSEAYFACLAMSKAIKHLKRYYVRDYVLDMLDHVQGLAEYVPNYPQPTFGPDQRFLTKGGYLIPVIDGHPRVELANWTVP